MNKNNLTPKQQQQLADIGAQLQQIRLGRGISLHTIAQKTLISQRLLQGIETGNSNELPEPFYIQALVSKYAQALGTKEIYFVVEPETDLSAGVNSRQKSRRQYWFNFQLRSLHLYLLYILLVIISVSGITALVERPVAVSYTHLTLPTILLV